MIERLQTIMANDVGPFRTGAKLERALRATAEMMQELGDRPACNGVPFDLRSSTGSYLRNMLLVARSVATAALARRESRGATSTR